MKRMTIVLLALMAACATGRAATPTVGQTSWGMVVGRNFGMDSQVRERDWQLLLTARYSLTQRMSAFMAMQRQRQLLGMDDADEALLLQ